MKMRRTGTVLPLPVGGAAASLDVALDALEGVYAFLFRRVGNRHDAEDLTQQVALKAIPRLSPDAAPSAVRAYLFATARTELADFWAARFGLPQEELREDVFVPDEPRAPEDEAGSAVGLAQRILRRLPANYAKLLELRFLRGYSAKEIAMEMGSSAGAVRIMQLRALRAAAEVDVDA
jgi:RNA polymerase sigma-70 factor (ECF subfamily)